MAMSAPSGKGSCLSGLFMFTNICLLGTHCQSIFTEGMRRRWTPDVGGLSAQGRRNKGLSLAKSQWTMRLLRSPSSTFSGRSQALHFVTSCVLAGCELSVTIHLRQVGVWICTWDPGSAMNLLRGSQEQRDVQRSTSVQLVSRPRAEFNLLPSPSLALNGKRTLLEYRFLGQHFQCTFCVTGAWETVFQWLPVVLMLLAQWPWLLRGKLSYHQWTGPRNLPGGRG